MPIKFNKEMSTHLFKYVNTVEVKFNPFDARTVSAREIFVSLNIQRYKDANKRFNVIMDLHQKADPPKAIFTFFDGTKRIVDTWGSTAQEIIFDVQLRLSEMDMNYEMSGKNIDDETG